MAIELEPVVLNVLGFDGTVYINGGFTDIELSVKSAQALVKELKREIKLAKKAQD